MESSNSFTPAGASRLKIHDTAVGRKVDFVPLEESKVKMYVCGPTVYDYFHLGNARCFVAFDIARRWLEFRGYDVAYVQNFTDIDDKILARAEREGVSIGDISARFITEYETDAAGLGVALATINPCATDNIAEMIAMIEHLISKGHAYESRGDVYFDTASLPSYGALSKMPLDQLEEGNRTTSDSIDKKRGKLDFVLWKAAKSGEASWDSPWGAGRPGWHIECSAMVAKYLGKTIDFHCGGVDLVFPHHENERAQSVAAHGVEYAKYWLHNGFLNVDNEKMSKSAGNFFTVRTLAEKYGYMPLRFFLLSAHYRSPLMYDESALTAAASALERLHNAQANIEFAAANSMETADLSDEVCVKFTTLTDQFYAAMDDDFNTADAIGVLFSMVKEANLLLGGGAGGKQTLEHVSGAIAHLTDLLGLTKAAATSDDDTEIDALVQKRTEAKAERNFATADAIRNELTERGIVLEDTPNGTKWRRQ